MLIVRNKSGVEVPDKFSDYKKKRDSYIDNKVNTGSQIFAHFHRLPGFDPSDYCKGCQGSKRGRDVVHRETTVYVNVPAEPCPCKDPRNIRPNFIVWDQCPSREPEETLVPESPRNSLDIPARRQGQRSRTAERNRRRKLRAKEAIERGRVNDTVYLQREARKQRRLHRENNAKARKTKKSAERKRANLREKNKMKKLASRTG